jgi:hypothetical protein
MMLDINYEMRKKGRVKSTSKGKVKMDPFKISHLGDTPLQSKPVRKGTRGNRELAFRLYKEEGGRDIRKIIRRLREEHGLGLSAPTLHRWKKEGGWQARLEGVGRTGFDERMLAILERLIGRYEEQMAESRRLKDQSTYALLYLMKAARELRMSGVRTDPEEMRRVADEILRTEYGIVREEG